MLTVNLYDANFRHDVCSVAWKTPQHIQYIRDQIHWDGVTVFTDAYINDPVVDQVQSRYKIGWLHEPYCLHPDIYEQALLNVHKFDFIMTYYEPFLGLDPFPTAEGYVYKFKFAPYGGVWIDQRDWGIKSKTKNASMLIGNKMSTEGHRIRHEIADMLERIGFPVDFYGNRGTPTDYSPQTKLQVLADYRFSIVTETCREDNLFTEWLLDCFAVGTIPVFWGCPNVSDYFNEEGVASFANLGELIRTLPYLTVENYEVVRGAVEDNFQRVADYAVTEDWIFEHVLSGIHP